MQRNSVTISRQTDNSSPQKRCRSVLRRSVLVASVVFLVGSTEVLAQEGATAGLSPLLAGPTEHWYDFLTGRSRTEAAGLDRDLRRTRSEFLQARDERFKALAALKAGFSERLLSEIWAQANSSRNGAANSGSLGLLDALSGSVLAARSALIRQGEAYTSETQSSTGATAGHSIGSLNAAVRKLENERSTLLQNNIPNPGTPAFHGLLAARVSFLSDQGIDGARLDSIDAQLEKLPGSLLDIAAMKAYLQATGTDLARSPRSDDLAGWRFLMDQTVQSRWLSILFSTDPAALARALSQEAPLLQPLSEQLSSALSSFADEINDGERAIRDIRGFEAEFYADANTATVLIVADSSRTNQVPAGHTASLGVLQSQERNFGRFVADLQQVTASRLAVLVADDPLFEAIVGDTLRALDTVSGDDMVLFSRTTAGNITNVEIAIALLRRANNDGRDRVLRQFAQSGIDAQTAGVEDGKQYLQRRQDEAKKTLAEAMSALDDSADLQKRQWAFLSIMESRYALHLLAGQTEYAQLRRAFDHYLTQVLSATEATAVSILQQSTPGSAVRIAVVPVVENPPVFREVSAYREHADANGITVRDEIPVSEVATAYAAAFYRVTQGRTPGIENGSVTDWALMHGQASVNWEWSRGEVNPPADTAMNPELLDTFLHGVRKIDHRQLSDRVKFLKSVVAPWVQPATSGAEFGSDAVSGNSTSFSGGLGTITADRNWERLAVGFLLLRQEIVRVLFTRAAAFGFVPRDLLSDRERFTMELFTELESLAISPPDFFAGLSAAWLGARMTRPDAATASGLADAIVTGISGTVDDADRHYWFAARTAALVSFKRFQVESGDESAGEYALRILRRIDSDARRGRVTVGEFREARSEAFRIIRARVGKSGLSPAAVAELLYTAGLIRKEEVKSLEGP